jgi:hypothetical protein
MVMGDKQDNITKAREDIIPLDQLNNSSINCPEIYLFIYLFIYLSKEYK